MSTLALVTISLGGIGALAGIVAFLVWLGNRAHARAAKAEALSEMDRDALAAERKAGAVLGEHRTVADAADRLQRGGF
jgi:hypothetical protein